MKKVTIILDEDQLECIYSALIQTPDMSEEMEDVKQLISDVKYSKSNYEVFDFTA